jgi:hypothetical protein
VPINAGTQFQLGLVVELEHSRRDPLTNVSDDDEITTGKIALAHLNEFPDYYSRLEQMEAEAERYYWSKHRQGATGQRSTPTERPSPPTVEDLDRPTRFR